MQRNNQGYVAYAALEHRSFTVWNAGTVHVRRACGETPGSILEWALVRHMYIETTFKWYKKGLRVSGLHIVTHILIDMSDIRGKRKSKSCDYHREESKTSMVSDDANRAGIRETLSKYIESHLRRISNVLQT